MNLPRFTLDEITSYEAVAYGESWNGFLTPVVTRATLVELISTEGNGVTVEFGDDGTATISEGELTFSVAPSAEGTYDLDVLGWTFWAQPTNEGQ